MIARSGNALVNACSKACLMAHRVSSVPPIETPSGIVLPYETASVRMRFCVNCGEYTDTQGNLLKLPASSARVALIQN